jgi:hypothetical protein
MIYKDVVQAFLDLFNKDMSTYNEQTPYGFIIFAIRVLFHLYSDELESIGYHPPPRETDATKVFVMIKTLAKEYNVCLCCGVEIPTSKKCSPEVKAIYGYLDGWCPTCEAEFSHRFPLTPESVDEALDVFGLNFIA